MEEELWIRAGKKAALLAGGPVKVSSDFRPPFPLSRSTAGPGAGSAAIVLAFEGARVKKAISTEEGEFELVGAGPVYSLLRNGEMFIESVEIMPTLAHAPEQAFFNLGTRCIYNCKFCASPRLDERMDKGLDPDKIVALIRRAAARPDFRAVALTSAVVAAPQGTVDRMAYVISEVRKTHPDVPIGVEPYVDDLAQIDQLKGAGADEIKINIETYDRGIFEKVCGEQDFERIMAAIAHAGRVFGKGKVASNIIVGMGESDHNVLDGVRALAQLGCVATLRPLRLNDINRGPMIEALGPLEPISPDRILRLAKGHKRILEEHGLDTRTFHTMCHECTCCDIVPFRDI